VAAITSTACNPAALNGGRIGLKGFNSAACRHLQVGVERSAVRPINTCLADT
jgi:hypothetical protein